MGVTITMSNLVSGQSGILSVTNAATQYNITFSGYTFKIGQAVRSALNVVTTSGGSLYDEFEWYYNGSYVRITGLLDIQ